MLIGKLLQIGYTPRGSVEADASARLVGPDPCPRTLDRDGSAGAVRQAEVRQAEVRRPGCGGRQNLATPACVRSS